MPFVRWDESLALGKESIDRQHKGLFEVVNRLHAALGGGAEAAALDECVDAMSRYCLEHLRDEEAYMVEIGYPGLAEHKILHLDFMRMTSDLAEAREDGLIPFQDALCSLVRWLDQHIRREDLRYIEFARAKGLVVTETAEGPA
jgi:hemerythrin